MGTWGTGILSNDHAEDLKFQWKELLAEGHSAEDVSNSLIASAAEEGELNDEEDQFEFFTAFALIQWKSGRLQQNVKDWALDFLEDEVVHRIESTRWENQKDFKKRVDALLALRTLLLTDQPKPTIIKKPFHQTTNLKSGDLFSIRLASGNYIVLEVVEIKLDYKSTVPICVLYAYKSPIEPTIQTLENIDVLRFKSHSPIEEDHLYSNIALVAFNKRDIEPKNRIFMLQQNRNKGFNPKTFQRICEWSKIDMVFEEWLSNYDSEFYGLNNLSAKIDNASND